MKPQKVITGFDSVKGYEALLIALRTELEKHFIPQCAHGTARVKIVPKLVAISLGLGVRDGIS
jgi:hypothetical protein